MKWFLSTLLGAVLLLTCNLSARADHILGGTLGYKFISAEGDNSTYELTLELYNDCTSASMDKGKLLLSATVYYFKGSESEGRQRLFYIDSLSKVNVTPVCPDLMGKTTCEDPNVYDVQGVQRFVYKNIVTLKGVADNWSFSYFGVLGTGNETGSFVHMSRMTGNANVIDYSTTPFPTFRVLYLEARLNNTMGPNSSPVFTSSPIPFFCMGKKSYHNLGTADPDHDNLSYKLIPARAVNGNALAHYDTIDYRVPFTGEFPLNANAADFNLNAENGQMIFTPRSDTSCVVVEEVTESKNGVVVGSSMRQMTFIIASDCDAEAPSSPVSNVKNANYSFDANGNLFLSACEGLSDTVSFDINVSDPNHDNVTVSSDNIPDAANVTVENNSGQNPIVHFKWDLTDAEPVTYFFYLTYTDDGCPISTKKDIAYTFTVVPHNIKFSNGSSGSCASTADGKGWINPIGENTIDYTYKWVDANGNVLRNVHSLVGDTIKNVPPGVYKVYVRNSDGCGKNIFVRVDTTKPPVVVLQNDSTICEGMPISIGTIPEAEADYKWNTGQDTCCIIATQTGNYILNASNHCGAASDMVNLDFVKCNYCLFIPNAFSPNGDGDNDVFKIIPTCLMRTFKIQIFNRYGQMVYVSYSLNNSWDGTFRGKPAGVGTYYYTIKADYEDVSKGTLQLKGDVTLIK